MISQAHKKIKKELPNYGVTRPFRVGIVGLGPKGLYGLERLLANLKESFSDQPIEIYLINKTPYFGCGDVYRTDQPEYLMMNYANGFINMWPDSKPSPIVPEPISFVEWLKFGESNKQDPIHDEYSPRALVGRYLSYGFNSLLENCPGHISIVQHLGEITDLEKSGDKINLLLLTQAKKQLHLRGFDQLLLATGHLTVNSSKKNRLNPSSDVDFIYPVKTKLSGILPKSKVAVKGMGLTFIDAALALTEGRGGFFKNSGNELKYFSTGEEPSKIYPFSKSGLPMFPRKSTFGKPIKELKYFKLENFVGMGEKLPSWKVDFKLELLPLIKKEIIFSYYDCMFRIHGLDLCYSPNFREVETQIFDFHEKYPQAEIFEFEHFFPCENHSPVKSNEEVINLISHWINCAELGEKESPLANASGVWRQMTDLFNRVYSFGGLTPSSHQLFSEQYASHFNRVSYGPPVINMKKILALAKAGILDFSFSNSPSMTYEEAHKQYRLATVYGNEISTDFFVDARIPKYRVDDQLSPLYENLIRKGHARPFVNVCKFGITFKPGCVDLNRSGNPLDKYGNVVPQLTFTGTPTEGITFDNDSLSTEKNDFVSAWADRVADEVVKFRSINSLELLENEY
ncbi:FAD/NAD(P)-binding protein [Marivirga sp.]|uniref:FAD/NAD(P)-binding protein n=1 Tax=Marivirga sp. TaxID=2018662 RepID=UPI0025E76862|nr:FAD/NAD(P)-binding protein [Marivirga sp.]